MKKLFFLILISACSFLAKAQYSITASSNPIPGDVENFIDLDSTGLFFGSNGTSQTWNYSGIISLGNPAITNTYVSMSVVPNNTFFPAGTIAVDNGSGTYGVLSNTASKFEYYGYADPTLANCWIYTDPLKLYSIPFSYGSVSTDALLLALSTDTTTGTFTTTGSGTGTLQLPLVTYTNVLKLDYVLYQNDTYPSTIYDYTVFINQYYSAASKFLLLEVQTMTMSATSGTNVTWFYNKFGKVASMGISTSITNTEKHLDFNVFPNPVSNGELFISNTPSIENITVEVINVLGQRVKTILLESQNGTETKKIDVSNLSKGIYYLQIKGKEDTKTQKIIIE